MEFLEMEYFNNPVKNYLIALGIIVIGVLVIRVFRRIVLKKLRRWSDQTETAIDNFIVGGVERFGLPILNLVVVYWGIHSLQLSAKVERIVEIATNVAVAFFAIRLIITIVRHALTTYVRKQENGEEKVKQLAGLMMIVNLIIWGIGVVFLFDNLGYDVTAIIAGLGIGGIAVALAAQNILGDLFNYFVIFFDRPFEVGDFIIVDTKLGTVEHIGIKTTRVKSLTGEQLIFSNSDLTNSRIHNYKRMERRRIVFSISVVYQTKKEHLEAIPKIIRAAIEEHNDVQFDRSHFSSYGDSSLNFETVYFVLSSDYNRYMDIHQAINLRIFETFLKEGIEFAYPTRMLYTRSLDEKRE